MLRFNRFGLLCIVTIMLSLVLSGCGGNPHLVAKYYPDEHGRRPWEWNDASGVTKQPPPTRRTLKMGDTVRIYLRAIPVPDDIVTEVNPLGEVSLPHVGPIKVGGLTTAEAQKLCEKTYIDQKIFRSITVIIVPSADEFFVTGEVNRPAKYPLSRELTLMKAIATAGGYTDFANERKIEIQRNGKILKYDGKSISEGRDKDPKIQPGDIIRVHEHW